METTGVDTVAATTNAAKRDLDRLREAAGELVGSVFYGTLLRTMRESELKGRYGHGGRGEEVFGAQLHGIMAEEMGRVTKGGLAEVLYETLEHQQSLIGKLRPGSCEIRG